jgi:hypothetical protein
MVACIGGGRSFGDWGLVYELGSSCFCVVGVVWVGKAHWLTWFVFLFMSWVVVFVLGWFGLGRLIGCRWVACGGCSA